MNRPTEQKAIKRLDPVKTRASILDASFHEFAENGFEGASIADIATAAGVPKSLVQYHFGSKEALFQACVAQRAAPLLAVVDRFLRGEAAIEEILTARFQLLQANPDVQRMLAWASLARSPLPTVFTERKTEIQKRFGDVGSNLQLQKFLFLLAALDGWFLFRNLYRNLAGDEILTPEVEEQLLHSLLQWSNDDGAQP